MDFRNRVTSFVRGSSHKGHKIQKFTKGGEVADKTEKSESAKLKKRGERFGTHSNKTTSQKNQRGLKTRTDTELKHFQELPSQFYTYPERTKKPDRNELLETMSKEKASGRNHEVSNNTVFFMSPMQMNNLKRQLGDAKNERNLQTRLNIRARRTDTDRDGNVTKGPKRTHLVTLTRNNTNENFKHLAAGDTKQPKNGRNYGEFSSGSEDSDN